jgi:hypothetical protein
VIILPQCETKVLKVTHLWPWYGPEDRESCCAAGTPTVLMTTSQCGESVRDAHLRGNLRVTANWGVETIGTFGNKHRPCRLPLTVT